MHILVGSMYRMEKYGATTLIDTEKIFLTEFWIDFLDEFRVDFLDEFRMDFP